MLTDVLIDLFLAWFPKSTCGFKSIFAAATEIASILVGVNHILRLGNNWKGILQL